MKVYTVGRAIVKPIARVLFRVRYMGHKQVDCQNPYILCSNHISDLDPVFIILAAPYKAKICFMAKAELFKIKILGWFIKTAARAIQVPLTTRRKLLGMAGAWAFL